MRQKRHWRRAARIRAVRPPMRNGINASPLRLPHGAWATVDEWIFERFGEEGRELLHNGDIFADNAECVWPGASYRPGQRLWFFRPVPDEPTEPITVPILAQTQRYIIVDKPHQMATIPRGSHVAQSLTVVMRRQMKNDDIVAAHRLDAETAGCVLLTTDPQWRGAYQKLFEQRRVEKTYYALARYAPNDPIGVWQRSDVRLERGHTDLVASVVAGEPNSQTRLRLVSTYGELGCYELRPITGRTHQLRATMAHRGTPILADPLYPQVLDAEETANRPYPLQLIAAQLSFIDPYTAQPVTVYSNRVFLAGNGAVRWERD
ncbi:pseudouridine synthase [Trueperella sp. LYQ143]|uniref:pseudouridine synthase n=1 Tax=Trueperella sp. LYQ143 TaxID=3391059 RepID=UPI0039834031